MYGQYMFIVLVGVLLVGCKDNSSNSSKAVEDVITGDTLLNAPKEEVSNPPSTSISSPSDPLPIPVEPNALGNLVEIKMLPPEGQLSVPANSRMKLRITGIYDNGTKDITEQAELRILDDVSNITFTEDNQVQAGAWDPSGTAYNNTRIEAEFENVKAELTVNVMEGVCDEALTLAQLEALDGTCVMSHTYDGKEYLFVPRKKFMDRLGYTASNIEENEGRTYSNIYSNEAPYVLFRRDGKGMTWENFTQEQNLYGQAERFCRDLAQMSFNKKDGWIIASLEELEGLMNHHIDNNLMISGGLPLHYFSGYYSIWGREIFPNYFAFYTKNVDAPTKSIGYYAYSRHAVLCRSE
ncbi:conserved hypothetical protein [Vibrio chagasii]|nr:conserved hypothetical protein [Vibrio chagasii]CAH7251973.1 conserved hypothetical protein [Vibrio chagasii]CAH7452334.1 conserved hypothetical protein [Vibrio chagasii]